MEEHVGEMAIQMCREVLVPSAKRRRLLVSLVCILFEGTIRGPCFYSNNANMGSCEQEAVEEIYMRCRRATNKQRSVCGPCRDWLVEESLASIATVGIRLPCACSVLFSEVSNFIVYVRFVESSGDDSLRCIGDASWGL